MSSHLTPERITDIETFFAATNTLYDGELRRLLLNGINYKFLMTLQNFSNSALQLLGDLHTLNSVGRLADGTIPFEIWLRNAVEQLSFRDTAKILSRALDELTSAAPISEPPEGPEVAPEIRPEIADETINRGQRKMVEMHAMINESTESEPAFYFALEGKQVIGNVVEFGADVDLVFDYGALTDRAMGIVTGTPIDKARETGSEFGISVIPIGFKFRKADKRWYKVARFRGGKLLEQIRFLLKAHDKATTEADTGLCVTFYFLGHAQYSFSIPILLVRSLHDAAATLPRARRISIDLDKHIRAARFGEELLQRSLKESLL